MIGSAHGGGGDQILAPVILQVAQLPIESAPLPSSICMPTPRTDTKSGRHLYSIISLMTCLSFPVGGWLHGIPITVQDLWRATNDYKSLDI